MSRDQGWVPLVAGQLWGMVTAVRGPHLILSVEEVAAGQTQHCHLSAEHDLSAHVRCLGGQALCQALCPRLILNPEQPRKEGTLLGILQMGKSSLREGRGACRVRGASGAYGSRMPSLGGGPVPTALAGAAALTRLLLRKIWMPARPGGSVLTVWVRPGIFVKFPGASDVQQ